MARDWPDRLAALRAAAERAADAAPEIRPGDDVAMNLQRLYSRFPAWLAEHRADAGERPGHAA